MKIYAKLILLLTLLFGSVPIASAAPGGEMSPGNGTPIATPSPEVFGLIPLLTLGAVGVVVAGARKFKNRKIKK